MEYSSPNEIIAKVGSYLREPLSVDKLQDQLIGLEALRFELAERKVEWLQLLHEKESQMLYPKDKDMTELDRKVRLNASVAVIRKDYEMLATLEKLVEQRLQFGKLLIEVNNG